MGSIASFICSTDDINTMNRQAIFHAPYGMKNGWCAFANSLKNAGGTHGLLNGHMNGQAFLSLYMAAWIYHPVEKGTFMINLSGISRYQRSVVANAVFALPPRASSHLSGKGHSAAKQFSGKFLKGYDELLVQYEDARAEAFLFLKAEGHALNGVISTLQHGIGYMKKTLTGAGETANEVLNAVAELGESGIDPRAAENFGLGYKELVKGSLKMSNKSTIREVWERLYERFDGAGTFGERKHMKNDQLGRELKRWVELKRKRLTEIHKKLPKELEGIGDSLIDDGNSVVDRVFRELRVTPLAIDAAVASFLSILNDS